MAKGIKGERIKVIKRDSEKSMIVYLNNGRKLKFTAKYDYYGGESYLDCEEVK